MIRIPKIIHQTWKDDELPKAFQLLSESWKEMLPNWEYRLWTDEMNREFVKTHYPEFLEKFNAYPNKIQRADAIRYLLLQTYGGLYVDLDFECLDRNIVSLFKEGHFVVGKEPDQHARRYNREYIICNALMASVPNHPFLDFIIQRMMNHPNGWNVRHGGDILDSTGPFLITDAFNDFPQKESISIVEPELLYPIHLGESIFIIEGKVPEEMQQRIEKAYAIHYFAGTWW